MLTWLFLVAYAISGLAGLVYEVSWTRLLTLSLGHGLAASSTVLAAFMGGLALGAFAGGRAAARLLPRQALRVYAVLEGVVAGLALALPFGVAGLTPVFTATYGDGTGGVGFGLVRLAACALLLLPPAMALGATFPMAVRILTHDAVHPGVVAGRLYAANTLGAGVGAVLAGFVLLPAFGVTTTSWIGVAASVAALVLALGSQRPVAVADRSVAAAPPAAATAASRADGRRNGTARVRRGIAARTPRGGGAPAPAAEQVWLSAFVLTLTGVVTFTTEIAWTRVFALVIGPSTYAFAATVAVFIGGLAVGATAGSMLAARTRQRAMALGVVLGLAAIAIAAATTAAGTWLPRRVMADFAAAHGGSLLFTHAALAALLIAPAAIGIGAAFPIALELAGGGEAPSRRIGGIYALNTVASVVGSLLTGFVMIPLVGLERTLQLATLLVIVASAGALAWSGGTRLRQALAAIPIVVSAAIVVLGAGWDRELLASGSYKYASDVPAGVDVETALRAGTLIYYKDGATGTVSVKRLTGQLALAIDGKVDASTAGDMLTQKLLAHLPLLLHDDPQQVAIIGLGSGVTLASALVHPVRGVDALEISHEVAEASRLFTAGAASPLDDPRTRLVVADGRTHLALSTRVYDVIVSEPSNPWMVGVAALFTREFFTAARARLSAGGIICQWVNTYDISTADLQSVVATFASVFPHGTLWLVGEGDLLLLGSALPFAPRLQTMAEAWRRPGVAEDLLPQGVVEPFGVLSTYLGGDDTIARFRGDAAVQTDDRMGLEFTAPRALRTSTRRDNVERLQSAAASGERPAAVVQAWAAAGGPQLAHRAAMLQRAGAFAAAYQTADEAVTQAPSHVEALTTLVESAVALGRPADAQVRLTQVIAQHPEFTAPRLALSRLQASTGDLAAAAQLATDALARDPEQPAALEQLASVFADAGDAARLDGLAAALARHPSRPGSHYYLAALQFMRGDLDAAEAAAGRALRLDARYARAQNLVGAIRATRGDTDGARQAFTAALHLDPRDPTTYQNLGLLEMNAGRHDTASRLFAEALSLDPTSAAAREGLARTAGGR